MKKLLFAAALAATLACGLCGCTRDTAGKLQFDPAKACKAAVLAAPGIDAAKRVAVDAGAKPEAVEHGAAVATDLVAFASIVCTGTDSAAAPVAPVPPLPAPTT